MKKTVRNGIIMAACEQQKNVFREALLDPVGINFGNCRLLIDPQGYLVIAGNVFDIGYVAFERSLKAVDDNDGDELADLYSTVM